LNRDRLSNIRTALVFLTSGGTKMKKHFVLISLILVFTLFLSACGIYGNRESQTESVATAIAMTVSAMNAQTPLVTYVVITPTSTAVPLPTNTPLPTSTPYIAPTKTPSIAPTSTPKPCNWASFISEVPLDGATYEPGETFTKSWRLKNIGTCTWNPNYRVVYSSGDAISGADTKKLPNYVAPGEMTDIVYTFKAPSTPGTYKTIFKLQDDKGVNFAQFWVQIKVATEPFAVTGVTLSTEHADITSSCPHIFDYKAVIKANGAGTVTYQLIFSNGSISSTKSLTFKEAGSETINGSWEIATSGEYSIKPYIDQPNHQTFGPLKLSLNCTF
jgi:hypothetical protein